MNFEFMSAKGGSATGGKKILFLVGVLAVVTTLGASCGGGGPVVPPPTGGEAGETSGGDFSDEPTKNAGLLPVCLGINNANYRQICSALVQKDTKMCGDMVADEDMDKTTWQGLCLMFVAASSGKNGSAVCEKIGELAPGFDPGQVYKGPFGGDCYMFAAVGARDKTLCPKTGSVGGCEYNVGVVAGEFDLEQSDDYESLYAYAFRNKSTDACDKFSGRTGLPMDEVYRAGCLAMLSGNEKDCDGMRGVGVAEWSFCERKFRYGQARPKLDDFEPYACGDDDNCLFEVLTDMANFLGGK